MPTHRQRHLALHRGFVSNVTNAADKNRRIRHRVALPIVAASTFFEKSVPLLPSSHRLPNFPYLRNVVHGVHLLDILGLEIADTESGQALERKVGIVAQVGKNLREGHSPHESWPLAAWCLL